MQNLAFLNNKRVTILSSKGFTLIELVVSVAILTIMSALAVIQFNEYRKKTAEMSALQACIDLRTAVESGLADDNSQTVYSEPRTLKFSPTGTYSCESGCTGITKERIFPGFAPTNNIAITAVFNTSPKSYDLNCGSCLSMNEDRSNFNGWLLTAAGTPQKYQMPVGSNAAECQAAGSSPASSSGSSSGSSSPSSSDSGGSSSGSGSSADSGESSDSNSSSANCDPVEFYAPGGEPGGIQECRHYVYPQGECGSADGNNYTVVDPALCGMSSSGSSSSEYSSSPSSSSSYSSDSGSSSSEYSSSPSSSSSYSSDSGSSSSGYSSSPSSSSSYSSDPGSSSSEYSSSPSSSSSYSSDPGSSSSEYSSSPSSSSSYSSDPGSSSSEYSSSPSSSSSYSSDSGSSSSEYSSSPSSSSSYSSDSGSSSFSSSSSS